MKIITGTLTFFLITLCFAVSASAATFVVNTTGDTIDNNLGNGVCADAGNNCSLRAAISEANALPGADIITLGAAVYTQSLVAAADNSNAGGDWDITSQITINGVSQAATILQAATVPNAANERVLEVLQNGNLTLTNATVRHGRYTNVGFIAGGGIANSGTLVLDSVTVRNNNASSLEGASIGGGIYNVGTSLTLNNSTVTANTASASLPGAGFGGGIASSTSLTATIVIKNSSISGNFLESLQTSASGGGLYVGGVYDLTLTDSHFDNNTVSAAGGSEGGGARLVAVAGASVFNITNCTFNNNTAFSSMTGAWGGGLHLYTSDSTLTGTLNRVSIDGNRTQGNLNSRGGGLYVNPVGAAINLGVTNSSISQNTNDGPRGGGVELSDRFSTTASNSFVNFTNSTISGNSAGTGNGGADGGTGGGAHIEMTTGPMTVTFNFVTIADNFAFTSGGGIAHAPGNSTLILINSIVAGNGAGASGQDISGNLASQNFNHIGNISGAVFTPQPNDTSGSDPQLGLLQNNGGPTLTHLLAQASPQRNSIPAGANGCGSIITADQRGFIRPAEGSCDKGATEATYFAPGPWNVSGTITNSSGMPIRNAEVVITGGGLAQPLKIYTGNFGQYGANLPGATYRVSVSAKRFRFQTSNVIVDLNSDAANVNFTANPQFEGKGASDGKWSQNRER